MAVNVLINILPFSILKIVCNPLEYVIMWWEDKTVMMMMMMMMMIRHALYSSKSNAVMIC